MKYAVMEAGGKQYIAREGETVELDRMPLEVGEKVNFNEVVLFADGSTVTVGHPHVKGAQVKGTVEAHVAGRKIIVFKYRPKQRYRRKQGHRQKYTRVAIGQVSLRSADKEARAAQPKPAAKKAEATEKAAKTTAKKAEAAPKAATTTKPAAKKPATKKSAASKPAEKKPAAKKPATKKSAASKPAEKKPAAKKPASKKAASGKSTTGKTSKSKPTAKKSDKKS